MGEAKEWVQNGIRMNGNVSCALSALELSPMF